MITPNELDFLDNDIEVAEPDEYPDATAPSLIPEGTYDFVVVDFDATRNYETKLPDGKGFVLTVEVAEGPHAGRQARNMKVWSSPFFRNGIKVSGLGDFIRALDAEARWKNHEDVRMVLQKAVDKKTPFRARVIWSAFDDEQFAILGGPSMENKSPEQKKARKDSTVKYMRNFKLMPDGSHYPETTGPSGATIEARLEFATFIPSNKRR